VKRWVIQHSDEIRGSQLRDEEPKVVGFDWATELNASVFGLVLIDPAGRPSV
jgi:hypothetical protein